MACSAVFALVGGAIADKVGHRSTLLVGLILAVSGAFLLAVQKPWHLLMLAIIVGISHGFVSTGGQSYLLAVSPPGRLGAATAAYFLGRTASQALGAYAAGLAAVLVGFRTLSLSSAALSTLVALAALRWLPHELTADDRLDRLQTNQPGSYRWSMAGYGSLLRRADVLALGAVRLFPTAAWGAASLMFPLLIYRLSESEATVGLYGTVSLVAATGAQLATGRAIDRLGAGTLLVPMCVGILFSSLVAVVLNTTTTGLFVAGSLWSMTAWGLSTCAPALMRQIGRGVDDGRVVALMHTLWSIGMLSGTLVAGELVELGTTVPFVFASGCLILTCGAAFWFLRLTKGPDSVSAHGSGVGSSDVG